MEIDVCPGGKGLWIDANDLNPIHEQSCEFAITLNILLTKTSNDHPISTLFPIKFSQIRLQDSPSAAIAEGIDR